MHIRIISECFEKYKCPGVTFFLQSSRYVSNEQLYFKTTGLYDYFYFYLVCFTFSISFSLCFPISPSLFFLMFFLKPLLSVVEKLLYRYMLLLSRFSHVRLCATPETAAHQAPLSLGFSRQEHGSGLPFPSPMHESEK